MSNSSHKLVSGKGRGRGRGGHAGRGSSVAALSRRGRGSGRGNSRGGRGRGSGHGHGRGNGGKNKKGDKVGYHAPKALPSGHVTFELAEQELLKHKLKAAAYQFGGIDWVKFFKRTDTNHNGRIEFDEFVKTMHSKASISMDVSKRKLI